MYRVYLTNHGYFYQNEFASIIDALEWARGTCFVVSIWIGKEIVATWSPITGVTLYVEELK